MQPFRALLCKIANTNRAPLLPKLRGQFAEFLNEGYLDRLRILFSSTCVGLRYGHLEDSLEIFLGNMGSASSLCPKTLLLVTSRSYGPPDLPGEPFYRLERALPPARWLALLRHPIADNAFMVVLEF